VRRTVPALCAVLLLVAIPAVGVGLLRGHFLFGIILPYLALVLFIGGLIFRIGRWLASPVPFHIPTVCGQQKSLPWIRADNLESPYTRAGLIGRMALEILCFRTLLKNDRTELKRKEKLVYSSSRYLWLGAMLFHWSLLVILVRHLRFFTEPVLPGIGLVQMLDGAFQVRLQALFLTDIGIIVGLAYLLWRRMAFPQLRVISLPADYFALMLLAGVAVSGILMRQFFLVDVVRIKELAMNLAGLSFAVPAGIGTLFYVHLFLACVLFAYFPFSKLMHSAGVFLSPTRNLQNDSRMRRHVNPWNRPVAVHTYAEWEDEFRDAMKEAGMKVEKE
jgi:nitrate reductase gamma subunit